MTASTSRLALVAFTALLLAACGRQETAAPAAATAELPLLLAAADLATVANGGLSARVPVTGALSPVRQAVVNARVSAVVDQVLVREGERVRAGQLLVRQDTADLKDQLRQAEANLAAAQVDLQLTAALEQKKTELRQKGYISEIDWAAARGETEVKRSTVAVREAAVAIARKALADAALTAPMTGIVAARSVEPGTQVMPGQALLTVVDLGELELAAAVPARDVPRIRVGDSLAFRVDGYGNRDFTGTLARIAPVADSARTVQVYARIPNPDGALRGGLFVKGELQPAADATDSSLRVPRAALREDGGNRYLLALREGRLVRVEAEVLAVDGEHAAVKAALAAGEQVVVAELDARHAGRTVELTR